MEDSLGVWLADLPGLSWQPGGMGAGGMGNMKSNKQRQWGGWMRTPKAKPGAQTAFPTSISVQLLLRTTQIQLKKQPQRGLVAQDWNPSTREAEAGESRV